MAIGGMIMWEDTIKYTNKGIGMVNIRRINDFMSDGKWRTGKEVSEALDLPHTKVLHLLLKRSKGLRKTYEMRRTGYQMPHEYKIYEE